MQGLAAFGKYQCAVCGTLGVKLWRQYNTFADHLRLMCCDCAGKDQGQDVGGIDAAGKLPFIHHGQNLGTTDQIGGLVPAVPTNDGTFWGYTSVPQDAVEWWRGLPNRPCKDPEERKEVT